MEENKEQNKKLKLSFFAFLLGFIDSKLNKNEQSNKGNHFPDDPIRKLLTNFDEIQEILNKNVKYLYFNRDNIRNILYDNEEVIDLTDFVKIDKNISCYFYLDLLISENPDQVDYKYSIDFIKEINNLQKNNNDKKYQKIIISKIIIDLINYYKQTDDYNEENDDEILDRIENENEDIINKNINIFNEIGLNKTKEDINNKKVDEIYIQIIIGLIKINKIGDNGYINKIINELDLENISITKTMFDILSNYLNSNENNLQDYIINTYDDLFKETIINFYYFLFKYILKNSIYIYQNNFLFKIRKNIFNFIKGKNEHNMSDIDTNLKDKLIYIINTFTDSKYYFDNYINNSKIEDKEVVINTYQSSEVDTNPSISNPFSYLSYKNATRTKGEGLLLPSQSLIEIAPEKKTAEEIADYILKDSSFTFDIKKNEMILNNKITYKTENKDKKIVETTINYGNLHIIKNNITNKNTKIYKSFNNLIQFLKGFPGHIKININNNFKIVLEFKRKIKDEEKNGLYNINLKYKLQDKNIIIFNNYEDEDILNINLDSSNGFLFFMNEIENYQSNKNENENEKKDSNDDNNINGTNNTNKTTKEQISSIINSNSINKMPKSNINKANEDKYNKIASNRKNEYEIMEITGIDENYAKKPEYIYETKNGILIIWGIDNLLYFNNPNSNEQKAIEILRINNNNDDNDKKCYEIKNPLNIYEKDSNQNENNEKLDLIICTRIGLISMQINCKDFSSCEQKIINEEPCSVYFQNGDNNYIIAGENFIFQNYYGKNKKITFDDIKNIKGAIKINNNKIVFTSTTNLSDRKDKFIIYDIKNTTIKEKEIGNFSFTNSANSFCLMRLGELEDNILLCGCKKGNEYQKNGFLIMDMKRDTEDKIEFCDTQNFEAYCFCPIFYINETNKEILYTDYFLVGGFSNDKREGMIKLFKIINNEDTNYITKVEFKQDISFERFDVEYPKDSYFKANNINEIRDKRDDFIFTGFRGNISCIMQSKINGNIYVTCWDGNIYKLTPPNISLYLKSDLEELKELENEKSVENLPN